MPPTKAELQKQLATIQAGLLDFTTVGEASYFKQTGQTKLSKKDIPRYTDVYKAEFEPIKDIKFSIDQDITTAETADKAFYVFDAARIAEKRAQQQISSVEENNAAVIKQQEDIKTFLAGEKEAAKVAVLQTYLNSIMNPTVPRGGLNPFEWETVDINTREGWSKWQNTARNMRFANQLTTADGRSTNLYQYRIKLTPAQIAEKRKTTEAIERVRFMSSPTLQKTYATQYAQRLAQQIKGMK